MGRNAICSPDMDAKFPNTQSVGGELPTDIGVDSKTIAAAIADNVPVTTAGARKYTLAKFLSDVRN